MRPYHICRIPLAKGGKIPLVFRWSTLPPDDESFARVFSENPGCNTGVRLDHLVVADCDTPEMVAYWLEHGPVTPFQSRGREDRRSFWYRVAPGCEARTVRTPGLELRGGTGAQCAVPPSIHPSGRPYVWLDPDHPVDEEHWDQIPQVDPDELEELLPRAPGPWTDGNGWDAVEDGGRDDFLAGVGGYLRSRGMSESGIFIALRAVNQSVCVPPKSRSDIERIARSMSRYQRRDTYEIVIE